MKDNVLKTIQHLEKNTKKGSCSPHRFALLLAISKLFNNNPSHQNIFHIDEQLEKEFRKAFLELSPNSKISSIQIEYPFYHLQSSGLWNLHIKKEKEIDFQEIIISKKARFTKKRLLQLISHASLSRELYQFMKNDRQRENFIDRLKEIYKTMNQSSDTSQSFLETIESENIDFSNPFVGYLNSLQQVGGSNENALAESQVCNNSFSLLHVAHPLVQIIYEELHSPSNRHVILTGHAGDGKSTLAIDVLKKIKGMISEKPLPSPISPRVDLEESNVTIIKDLSEQDNRDKGCLINELCENERRFLLVSNTGTLLDLFKEHRHILEQENVPLESSVLKAISNEAGAANLNLKGVKFKVFNLARMDNLYLARKIFERMLDRERWVVCESKKCSKACPICINVDLVQRNKARVVDRIFLAYRRMYEYGIRLTLRQLTEHLSYIITSGLESSDVQKLQEKNLRPLKIEYMFFNRFFGDNGVESDPAAERMKSVKTILGQGFGERPSPLWEHRLWLKNYGQSFSFDVPGCKKEFEWLREQGAKIGTKNNQRITPDRAREQVRRMLYFLYDFKKQDKEYLGQYLNSPTLLNWVDWQKKGAGLGLNEKTGLEQKLFHVLQEHFTGVRLPEGSSKGGDRRLYITLSRPRREVRQSAQIVLAQIDWSTAIDLGLKEQTAANGQRRNELVLQGKEPIRDIDLDLGVPFLDYVVMRHFGEFGEVLQAAYIERLDRYKARLQNRMGSDKGERIMLVHLKTDHTFRRQQYGVTNGTLEVSDVL
jgi:hypothetical protein